MKLDRDERNDAVCAALREMNNAAIREQRVRGPARATVILVGGRWHLAIRGWVVATEGDVCREPDLDVRVWTHEALERMCELVNMKES